MMSWGFDGWIWMAVWIGALLLMVWMIVRNPTRPSDPEAMAILRSRFARGEISKEQFEQARAVLLNDR
jgi:uncharacterized membrane protein